MVVKLNGGKHSAKVTSACTHLVASQKDFDGQSVKGRVMLWSSGCMVRSLKYYFFSFARTTNDTLTLFKDHNRLSFHRHLSDLQLLF